MFARLLTWIGVDHRQFVALLRLSLMVDFRTGMIAARKGKSKGKRRGLPGLWQLALFYGFLGLVLSFVIIESANVFFTGTVVMTITMFAVAMSLLVEFQSVIVSPDDYHILAHRPIGSRTFFMARMANLFVYIGVITGAIGVIPVALYVLRDGFNPLLGLATLFGMMGASLLTGFFIVFLYINLLRVVHPARLRRVFSYMQLLLSFIVYGSGMIFSTLLDKGVFARLVFEQDVWTAVLPPTWFTGFMMLAAGRWSEVTLLATTLGVGLTVMLVVYAYGKLSLSYAALLARQSEVSEKRVVHNARHRGTLPMFRRGEGRAAALLIRNQFKHDQKFRLSVLAIIPLTVLYLIAGLAEGTGLADPFVDPARHVAKANLLYFAMAFFPVLLMASLARSDSFRASWIFHATPSDKGKLVLAMKDVLVVYFIAPYLLALGVIFSFFFTSFQHVAVHVLMLTLVSHLFLQMLVFTNPFLPFSLPLRKGERTSSVFIGILVAAVFMTIIINVLARLVYPSATATSIVLLVLAVMTLLFERAAAERVRRKALTMQYLH